MSMTGSSVVARKDVAVRIDVCSGSEDVCEDVGDVDVEVRGISELSVEGCK